MPPHTEPLLNRDITNVSGAYIKTVPMVYLRTYGYTGNKAPRC